MNPADPRLPDDDRPDGGIDLDLAFLCELDQTELQLRELTFEMAISSLERIVAPSLSDFLA